MIPLLTDLHEVPSDFQGGVVAVGNFDGVHRGHASLIKRLVSLSKQLGGRSLVITFDPHPSTLLRPDLPVLEPLTTLARRAELLGELGVDGLLALPTSPQLLELSPIEFYQRVLVGELKIRGMVEGPNFRFGKDREGDVQLLQQICSRDQIQFQVADSIDDPQGMISSSRIRQLLVAGDVAEAAAMLTRPFRVSGIVTRGAGRGTGLGFPTANLAQIRSMLPGHGVYAGRVEVGGQAYRAAMNLGPNPTFGENRTKVEVHIIDLKQDLYGQTLHCDMIAKVRDVVRFEGIQQLLAQIEQDLTKVVQLVQI
jgi:riboflavin kinase / FMN adenylyltransferase